MRRSLEMIPAWDRLLKRILWEQLGPIRGKRILDFGSGEGITADHYAADNDVTAIEPSDDMLKDRWADHPYRQIVGDIQALTAFPDASFDVVLCHNVLEYIDDKASVLRELTRTLKPEGRLSLVKHHRAGRIMQMAVLLDDIGEANRLLDGENSTASRFGAIRYYEDRDVTVWTPALRLEEVYGIRTFWDLQQNQEKHADEAWQQRMMQLELRVSGMEEFRNIAFFHHLLFRKEHAQM